jgi:hypothetical protein
MLDIAEAQGAALGAEGAWANEDDQATVQVPGLERVSRSP